MLIFKMVKNISITETGFITTWIYPVKRVRLSLVNESEGRKEGSG